MGMELLWKKHMNDDNDRFFDVCLDLDDPRIDITGWETDFLENILTRFPENLSEKQKVIIRRMAKQYLGEDI